MKFETDGYLGNATTYAKFGFCTFSEGVSPYTWSRHPWYLFWHSFPFFFTF